MFAELRQVVCDSVGCPRGLPHRSRATQGLPAPIKAIYRSCRFTLSCRDVQELPLECGISVAHETVRACRVRFGPDIAEQLRSRVARRGRTWHADEMRVVINEAVH